MIRININIALIDMLDATLKNSSHDQSPQAECFITNKENNTTESFVSTNKNSRGDGIDLSGGKQKSLSFERNLLNLLSVIILFFLQCVHSQFCSKN